jgi:surface antigen
MQSDGEVAEMRRPSCRLAILIAVAALLPLAPTPASAASSTPTGQGFQNPSGLSLTQAEQQLTTLNDQVERAGGQVDSLNRQLKADLAREASLQRRLRAMARLQYQRPALSVTLILSARSLNELISDLSQARLVADKEQSLLSLTRQLHQRDQQARDQAAASLSSIRASRDAASRMVGTLLGAQRQMALAVSAVGTAAGRWPNHFAFGFCTYYVASRRNVPWFGNANQWIAGARAYGFAEGSVPRVGSIMVTAEGPIGHVAYVEAVHPDGSWTVAEMNFAAWNVVDRRTIRPGGVPLISPGFIY